MFDLYVCLSVHCVCTWCLWRSEEGVRTPVTKDGCELSYGCLESNTGPPEEQPVLLTVGPTFQP